MFRIKIDLIFGKEERGSGQGTIRTRSMVALNDIGILVRFAFMYATIGLIRALLKYDKSWDARGTEALRLFSLTLKYI